jgi:hypothetical protein
VLFTAYGSGALSFLFAVRHALAHVPGPDAAVYLAEDDFLHLPRARAVLPEGLALADYVTGYDHGDKYVERRAGGPNPYVRRGGEVANVMLTRSSHWKSTGSTTMTFLTTLSVLARDNDTYYAYCKTGYPYDFEMFTFFASHGTHLVTTLPGVSSHAGWETPLVDWQAAAAARPDARRSRAARPRAALPAARPRRRMRRQRTARSWGRSPRAARRRRSAGQRRRQGGIDACKVQNVCFTGARSAARGTAAHTGGGRSGVCRQLQCEGEREVGSRRDRRGGQARAAASP